MVAAWLFSSERGAPLQIYALSFIGVLPVLSAIRDRGPKARWFYWFYPLHFIPLILKINLIQVKKLFLYQ